MERYPTEEELGRIRNYPHSQNYTHLFKYIESIWEYADGGGFKNRGRTYWLHTFGWSGNEDIIGAMQDNFMFWTMCWQKSERGGHFKFQVPRIKKGSDDAIRIG